MVVGCEIVGATHSDWVHLLTNDHSCFIGRLVMRQWGSDKVQWAAAIARQRNILHMQFSADPIMPGDNTYIHLHKCTLRIYSIHFVQRSFISHNLSVLTQYSKASRQTECLRHLWVLTDTTSWKSFVFVIIIISH